MKLTTKLQFGFALPTLFLLILGGASIVGFWRINRQVVTIYDDRVVPLHQLKEISDAYAVLIIDTVNKTNAGMLTGSQALINVNKAEEIIAENWKAYRQTNLTDKEEILAKEIETLFVAANQKIQRLDEVLTTNDLTKISQFDGSLYQQIDPLTDKIKDLIQLQLDVAKQQREEAATIFKIILWTFIPFLTLTVILVISPIRVILSRSIVGAFKEIINSVAAASTEIAAATEEQERLAEQQAASVHTTTTTMDELEVASQQSARQAETVAAGAAKVLALSGQGNQAVAHTLEEMSELKEKVNEIALSISQLNQQISQIDNYQKLVGEIANETNMLALNAAVEAVRAGEHGKGFAVVASEIRKLADQSKQSAEKINVLVTDIQTAIKTTVKATELGTETVAEGVIMAKTTAEAFQGVLVAINDVVLSSQQISLTSKQQAVAIGQVVNAMNSLSQAARETASGITQTKIGTQKLNQTALNLREMV